jgi:hypothetical protein
MFPRDYVELIGIVDPDADDRGLISRMDDNGEGLDRIAFAVSDVDESVAALRDSGYRLRGPLDLRRPLELPDGEVEPRFRIVHFEQPDATPGFQGFICHHETPEITRGDPSWLEHANGVTSIASTTIVVDDPEALAEGWQRLIGPGSTVLTDNTLTVHSGDHAMIFVTPDHLAVMFPTVADLATRRPPFIAAATFRVRDAAATASYLSSQDIPARRDREGGLQVPPDHAHGVIVAFEQDPGT